MSSLDDKYDDGEIKQGETENERDDIPYYDLDNNLISLGECHFVIFLLIDNL